ncbi:MAG: hypothetical protein ABEJ31_08050 [Haloarculaceae archaeon]
MINPNTAICPACNSDDAERTAREFTGEGMKITYDCPDCDNVWDVVF